MINDAADVVVVPMLEAGWPQVAAIYAAGIAAGSATFETEPPTWTEFDESRLLDHRHVAIDLAGQILGWTAASQVSRRAVYSGVVEHGVYVHPDARGRGIGRALLEALIEFTEAAGIWTIQSGIFPENRASLALHHSAGFRIVGVRERIGRMSAGPLKGQWRDVVLVERRSARVD